MEPTLNRHLWLLTGRTDNFVTPTLNSKLNYEGPPPSAAVLAARSLLHLGDTSTDYYVIGAMAALTAFRPLAGPDTSPLFLPRTLQVAAPSISGGSLRPAGPQHPSMLHRPSRIPAPRVWYVTCKSSTLVRITTDTGYDRTVVYRLAAGVVYIDWPEEIGFHAAFAPTGGVWVDGSQVIIRTEPSGYPYPAVAKQIRQSTELVRLMSEEGTLSAFHAAQSSLQKVGALAAAVVQFGATANRV
jgi:hypothetical protein